MSLRWFTRVFLSISVSLVLLWYTFHDIQFELIQQNIHKIKPIYLFAYVLSLIFLQFFRAWRWQALVKGFISLNFLQAFKVSNIGNMMIVLMPFRLGELARPAMMQKDYQMPMSKSLASVTVERILDGLSVGILFFITCFFIPDSFHIPQTLHYAAFLVLLFFLGLSLILFLSFYYQNYLFQYLNFLFKPLPKRFVEHILQTIQNFIEGLRSLPDKYAIQSIVYNTLAYWLVSAWGLYMLSIALGMDVDFWGSCLLVCLLIVGIMLPAGPGMLGTYQGALMTGLNIFSVEHDKNLTFIFMAYPLNILIVVLFGGYYFLVSKQPFYKKTVV